MTIKYRKVVEDYFLEASDENEQQYEEIEYEPSDKDLNECVATCVFNEYFGEGLFDCKEREEILNSIKEFIVEKELVEMLAKHFYGLEVVEWFKHKALGGI